MKKAPASNREWVYWGEHDPLFGVLTRKDRDLRGERPWNVEEFRADGSEYFETVLRQWSQYGCGTDHCVEIGCGSGRITVQLAKHFLHVTGLDVSPGQLAMAAEILGEQAADVDLRVVSEPVIPLADATCDAVFSCEVFQHFDSFETVVAYFREAARVLRPGGTLCIQIPIQGVHSAGFLGSSVRQLLLRAARMLGRRRMMVYRLYPASEVLSALSDAGLSQTELRFFPTHEHHGHHGYCFATRPVE